MGYKNITKQLVMFNEFFVFACPLLKRMEDEDVCKSKSKEKQEEGLCAIYDCPLVYEASLTELKELDKDLYDQHLPNFTEDLKAGKREGDCYPSSQYGSDWTIQYREPL